MFKPETKINDLVGSRRSGKTDALMSIAFSRADLGNLVFYIAPDVATPDEFCCLSRERGRDVVKSRLIVKGKDAGEIQCFLPCNLRKATGRPSTILIDVYDWMSDTQRSEVGRFVEGCEGSIVYRVRSI